MAIDYEIGQPVMMQLGAYQFGIATAAYQELTRSTAWRWPSQDRFGQLAALQFTGPGEDTMTLPGVLFPEWRGGFDQLERMRSEAGRGQPLALVDGEGGSVGRWVIESVEERQSVFAAAGKPRRVEFTLQLRRFPDDNQATASASPGLLGAVASTAGASIPFDAAGPVAQVQGLAGSVSASARSLSGTFSNLAGQVSVGLPPLSAVARDALGGVARSSEVVGQLQSVADRTLSLVNARPLALTAVASAQNMAAKAADLVVTAESAGSLLRKTGATMATMAGVPAGTNRAVRDAANAADRAVALARATAAQAATIKDI